MVFEPNIENAVLTKFLLNNYLNAIGALIGSSYGELVEDPQSRGVLIRLADEAIGVLGATREYKSFDKRSALPPQQLDPHCGSQGQSA